MDKIRKSLTTSLYVAVCGFCRAQRIPKRWQCNVNRFRSHSTMPFSVLVFYPKTHSKNELEFNARIVLNEIYWWNFKWMNHLLLNSCISIIGNFEVNKISDFLYFILASSKRNPILSNGFLSDAKHDAEAPQRHKFIRISYRLSVTSIFSQQKHFKTMDINQLMSSPTHNVYTTDIEIDEK